MLNGTSRADIIQAVVALICEKGGNEVSCRGDGNDRLRAAGGSDQIFGKAGNDHLFGEASTDSLDGALNLLILVERTVKKSVRNILSTAAMLIGGLVGPMGPVLLLGAPSVTLAQTTAVVGIAGTAFTINGSVTYPSTSIEGLLMNSRMINAIFDDDNPATVGMWAYPDTGVWDPQRNTNEFIAALPSYAAKGLKAFTLGLQGGRPVSLDVSVGTPHPWIVSAFNADGSLKQAWLDRADQVIRAADRNGFVVVLQYFYQHQEDRLASNQAVLWSAPTMQLTG